MNSKQRRQNARRQKKAAIANAKLFVEGIQAIADDLESGKDVSQVVEEIRECKYKFNKLVSEIQNIKEPT